MVFNFGFTTRVVGSSKPTGGAEIGKSTLHLPVTPGASVTLSSWSFPTFQGTVDLRTVHYSEHLQNFLSTVSYTLSLEAALKIHLLAYSGASKIVLFSVRNQMAMMTTTLCSFRLLPLEVDRDSHSQVNTQHIIWEAFVRDRSNVSVRVHIVVCVSVHTLRQAWWLALRVKIGSTFGPVTWLSH